MIQAATKPADLVEKRKPLTRAETLFLCIAQQGRCGCGCGKKLDPITEGVIDEHVIALELTGPNDLSNRSLYRKPCAVEKTKQDRTNIAKCKRLAGETCNGLKRPIQSRGFDKPAVPQKIASRPFPKRAKSSETPTSTWAAGGKGRS